jgi:hypothetical protein
MSNIHELKLIIQTEWPDWADFRHLGDFFKKSYHPTFTPTSFDLTTHCSSLRGVSRRRYH